MAVKREEIGSNLHDAASKTIYGMGEPSPESPTSVIFEERTFEVTGRKGLLVRDGVELTSAEVGSPPRPPTPHTPSPSPHPTTPAPGERKAKKRRSL